MDGSATHPGNSHLRNDVHSRLNPTRHAHVLRPAGTEAVADAVRAARDARQRLAIAGAQHAMGGQQFAHDAWLLDTRGLDRVLGFDAARGLVHVGAGLRWPQLQAFLASQRAPDGHGWAIRQKQTGADDFSLGGALASNIHGRGLRSAPFVQDIDAFTLVDADGVVHRVDRRSDPRRFALAIGGYGLFGVVTDLVLRLEPRRPLRRRVQLLRRDALDEAFTQAQREGAWFGDFQFAIDPRDDDFLDRGIFACYLPCDDGFATEPQAHLGAQDWQQLLHLAHTDKRRAFERYAAFYLGTDGQRYASDDHQFGVYLDGYHAQIDACLGHAGSELITELYVPPACIDAFLAYLARTCRRHAIEPIYGTVRRIRADTETRLAWAREDWACVVLNVHVRHDDAGRRKAADDMRRLIDAALGFRGSFYLTYHRHARADQLHAAYPHIDAVFAEKRALDPEGVFASDWYRAVAATLAEG